MRGPEGAPVQQCTGATRQSVEWRLADAGDVTSGQCLGPVPAMTCVAGNGRVRSSWESPRVPVPSRVHRRGEGWEWDDYPEILDDASSAYLSGPGRSAGETGTVPLRCGRRRSWSIRGRADTA